MLVRLHAKSQIVSDLPDFNREGEGPHDHTAPIYADADLTAEEAGRLCYLSGHRPSKKTEINPDYLLNICAQRHYSVLGHASASIYVETSRNTTHEIIRSRWFTFSEVSQRYVDAGEFEFQQHPGLDGKLVNLSESAGEKLEEAWHASIAAYEAIVEVLVSTHGYNRKEARQAARGILPGGIWTGILISGNLRAWRDFLAQRLSLAADLEIRNIALEIYKIMKREFPNTFQDFDSKGMITTDRLVARALGRLDSGRVGISPVMPKPLIGPPLPTGEGLLLDFEREVRAILKDGLWVLKNDPWTEGSY